MTFIIIFLLSCISAYLFLKVLAILLDTNLKNLLISDNEIYVMYQTFMIVMMTFVFFMMYCAINNTFLHFKY